MSNSGDISIEDCISDEEDDDDLKQRVDKLLSMAEYTEEIYHYLRKAEVCFPDDFSKNRTNFL